MKKRMSVCSLEHTGKLFISWRKGNLTMLLTTQTSHIFKIFGEQEGIRILKRAGYDALDLTLCRMSRDPSFVFLKEDALQYAEQVKGWAKKEGLLFRQAHTPFEFNWGNPNELEDRFMPLTVKAMEIAAVVGAKIVVVHPYNHMENEDNKNEIFDFNIKLYRRLIPYAREFGIKVALENMYRVDPVRRIYSPNACGTPEEFIKYIDTLDSEWITACLDLGHSSLVGVEAQDFIRTLGHDRLQALHVHDNDYTFDSHTLPGIGKMNWEEITKALADIQYSGDFTYEADQFLKGFEDDFKPTACRFMAECGRHLISKIKTHQTN